MARILSLEVREELVACLEHGNNLEGIAEAMSLGKATVWRYASGERDHLLTARQVRIRKKAWDTYKGWWR